MKKTPFKKSSLLALRSALLSALITGSVSAGVAKLFFDINWYSALLFGGILMLVTLVIVYFVIYTTQFSRLKILNEINRNISRKRFRNYDEIKEGGRDELDFLVKQSIRTSKTIEREIQRLNRIENYRKEFIGDISHELKTPIFAIQGFIETLLNGAIDDEGVNRRFLEKAQRNVNRLIYLTKDLMEISKLETGELKSEEQHVPLREIIQDVVENLQHKARNENVTLKMKDLSDKIIVSADRNQIKQVLINLIENAIKYNYNGGSVTVGAKTYSKNEDQILVYVKDTGIGINQQFIERLTERFYRVDKSRSREKGGTGLGLAIVKHIMEAHGEELFIESTPKVGSTFSFTLSKVDHKTGSAKIS